MSGYYQTFPPEETNVAIETREGRKVAIVTKNILAGETIYKEHPVVTALDSDLQGGGAYCANCFRLIEPSAAIQLPTKINPLSFTFCSSDCLNANRMQSHTLLFTTESPLPDEIANAPSSPEATAARQKAQESFVIYLNKERRAAPLLVARFIARQVAIETAKMVGGGTLFPLQNDYMGSDSQEYLLADHMERLRYLDVKPPAEEMSLLVNLLQTALPGLEQFVTSERHATLLGKMAYNAIGVYFGEGRDDKPAPDARPEDVEKTRTPCGTHKQIGSAFYLLSSYLSHSCDPSARPSFDSGTSELHLKATRDLKKGNELTMAYVDVTQHPGESPTECRRRRRIELARGWRFACGCSRCAEEAATTESEEAKTTDPTEPKDESKTEEPMQRYEASKVMNQVES